MEAGDPELDRRSRRQPPGPERGALTRSEHRLLIQRRRRVALGLGLVIIAAAIIAAALGADRDASDLIQRAEAQRDAAAPPPSPGPDPAVAQEEALGEVLGYTPFLRAGSRRNRVVALTFDDGPGPYTRQILDILRRHDAKATFFVLGNMIPEFSETAERALREGHAIGLHGFDHPHMGSLSHADQRAQLRDTKEALRHARLPVPRLFRPPYGSFNQDTLDLLEARETLMVLWSADTDDYLNPGSDVIAERALEGAKPGAVILMHDAGGDRSQTVAALPKILRGLKRRNLKPVTVPELLVDNPPPRRQTLEQATAVPPPGQPGG